MGLKLALLLIGAATTGAAILGLVRGEVYARGGPYSRKEQPARFWGAIVVYLLWSALMGYFAFFGD